MIQVPTSPLSPYGSRYFEMPIKLSDAPGAATITTQYAADAQMSNAAAGYGIARITIYTSDKTTVATDANGLSLSNIYMRMKTLNGGTAYYTIAPGLATAGKYYAKKEYGVHDSFGNLDWREPVFEEFTVLASVVPTSSPIT